MNNESEWRTIDLIFKSAMSCNDCFEKGFAAPAYLDIPQPRGIGREYFSFRPCTLILLLNPGRGDNQKHRKLNSRNHAVLASYKNSQIGLQEYMQKEIASMESWGRPAGKFTQFMQNLGLSLDRIAVANIAWCAEAKNDPPKQMLSHCFRLHTSRLLKVLAPTFTIVMGGKAGAFEGQIKSILPDCRTKTTLHYAHRKGEEAEHNELKRLRQWLDTFSSD